MHIRVPAGTSASVHVAPMALAIHSSLRYAGIQGGYFGIPFIIVRSVSDEAILWCYDAASRRRGYLFGNDN